MGNKQGKEQRRKVDKSRHGCDTPLKMEALQANLVKSKQSHGEEYCLTGSLGKGTVAGFKKAHSKKFMKTEQNTGVAIKLFDGQSFQKSSDFKTEAKILGRCDHPNIVNLFEITKVNNKLSLVLELCDGGSVLERLPYKEHQVSKIVRQVCSAVSYMHGKNIVHRDIECSNIMYSTLSEDSEVKLVDFGSACELEMIPNHPGAYKFLTEKTGSLSVMAPEVIRGKYGPKADVWSIGVMTYTLLNNGEAPFKGASKEEMESKILQGTIDYTGWQHSQDAKAFCKRTCLGNERQRLSAVATLYDPWIASTEKNSFRHLPVELVTSFSSYRTALPLKRIGLNALATRVKSSKYREVFERLNKSHTGLMTQEEFMEGFKHSGNSEKELYDIYRQLDINNNGGITYTEFIAATLEEGGELGEGRLREAFELISSNGRYITKKDVESIISESLKDRGTKDKVKNMAEHQMRRFTKKHQEEKIQYEDFAQMFEHGFKDLRSMDIITEMSLDAEQFARLNESEKTAHMSFITE